MDRNAIVADKSKERHGSDIAEPRIETPVEHHPRIESKECQLLGLDCLSLDRCIRSGVDNLVVVAAVDHYLGHEINGGVEPITLGLNSSRAGRGWYPDPVGSQCRSEVCGDGAACGVEH